MKGGILAVLALVAAALLVAPAAASGGLIDDFTTDQDSLYGSALYPRSTSDSLSRATTARGPDILGGERDIYVSNVTIVDPGSYRTGDAMFTWVGDWSPPLGMQLFQQFAQLGVGGDTEVQWDGPDGDATTLDPTGLGGVDLTEGGTKDKFFFRIGSNGRIPFTLTVYTNATSYSSVTVNAPFSQSVGQTHPLTIPFTSLSMGSGASAPADLTSVGAITLRWHNSQTNMYISLFEVQSSAPPDSTPPTITASAALPNGDPYTSGTWTNQDVTVSFACQDNPGGSGVASVSGATTVSTEGAGQAVTGTCTDNAGNSASATFDGINIDKTPPVVTFTGNQGAYELMDWVEIDCSATDALSGVASDTCADVSVQAYTLGTGTVVLEATATDHAGNTASAQTSFTVVVTPAGLCALTEQVVSKPGVAMALCAKLDAYAASLARGNARAAAGQLNAYINHVKAQSGKALAQEDAELLLRLAQEL